MVNYGGSAPIFHHLQEQPLYHSYFSYKIVFLRQQPPKVWTEYQADSQGGRGAELR